MIHAQPFRPVRFNKEWDAFFTDLLPQWVKKTYLPKSLLKKTRSEAFTEADARFFAKGVKELSEVLTVDRSAKHFKSYLGHPRFRSAYLLYFLPMNAAKFRTLFENHLTALKPLFQKAELRVLDLGAGPGTASIALYQTLLAHAGARLPQLECTWIDKEEAILKDGKKLFGELAPKQMRIRFEVADWSKSVSQLLAQKAQFDFILLGNVLNEGRNKDAFHELPHLLSESGQLLAMEPATQSPSQFLSQARDSLLENYPHLSVIGPCLHQSACPLSKGRDWCHWSIRSQLKGRWFQHFSRALGSEREWLKMSYLYMGQGERKEDFDYYRVLSDPIRRASGPPVTLLCAPREVVRIPTPKTNPPHRGDLFRKKNP